MKLKYKLVVGMMFLVPIFSFAQEAENINEEPAITNTAVASTTNETMDQELQTIEEASQPAVSSEVASESLITISDKLIDIDQESLKVRNELRSQIKGGIDKAVSYIRVQAEVQEKPVEQAFMYQRFVADILDESLKLIEERIRFSIPTSESDVNELAGQLDVYIIDIEESLEAYSDIVLDMQDTRDEVALTMSDFAEIIASKEDQLIESGADLINLDTDLDGLSDYDEVYIFNTDPNNAKTAGGDLNDSEKVSRGINPRSITQDAIDFSDPRTDNEAPTSKIYNVTRVELVDENGESISSTTQSTQKRVRLTGTGLPNSFITVYVFSTPVIVTVKTDSRGEWTYTLDKELDDGEHEVHVATVDNSGKILAKSNAVPFTQTASAASIGGFVGIGDDPDTGTGNFIQDNFLIVVIIIVLIGILITISLFGKKELKVVTDGPEGMNVKDTDTDKTEDK